jgi:hypothetical protein
MGVEQGQRMFARELAAGTGATENGFRWIGEISRRPIILSAAAFTIAEKEGAIRGAEKPDQFSFYYDAAGILYCSRIWGKRVGKSFIDFHSQPR